MPDQARTEGGCRRTKSDVVLEAFCRWVPWVWGAALVIIIADKLLTAVGL